MGALSQTPPVDNTPGIPAPVCTRCGRPVTDHTYVTTPQGLRWKLDDCAAFVFPAPEQTETSA